MRVRVLVSVLSLSLILPPSPLLDTMLVSLDPILARLAAFRSENELFS